MLPPSITPHETEAEGRAPPLSPCSYLLKQDIKPRNTTLTFFMPPPLETFIWESCLVPRGTECSVGTPKTLSVKSLSNIPWFITVASHSFVSNHASSWLSIEYTHFLISSSLHLWQFPAQNSHLSAQNTVLQNSIFFWAKYEWPWDRTMDLGYSK